MPPVAYAVMYCDYKDEDCQSTENVLGSMLGQIYSQVGVLPDAVLSEHKKCNEPPFWSRPRTSALVQWLRTVSHQTKLLVFVDALDESMSGHEIFRLLRELADEPGRPRIIVTSRPNLEVDAGTDTAVSRLRLEDHVPEVDNDIRQYVLARLDTDARLRKWSQEKYRSMITDGLICKSNGM